MSLSAPVTPSETTATSSESLILRTHLEKLPQELYDEIYAVTFYAPTEILFIFAGQDEEKYWSDSQLDLHLMQVDHVTRTLYGSSHNVSAVYECWNYAACRDYMELMSKCHRLMLKQIRCLNVQGDPFDRYPGSSCEEHIIRLKCTELGMSMSTLGFEFVDAVSFDEYDL